MNASEASLEILRFPFPFATLRASAQKGKLMDVLRSTSLRGM
jgi:hypothetical protein